MRSRVGTLLAVVLLLASGVGGRFPRVRRRLSPAGGRDVCAGHADQHLPPRSDVHVAGDVVHRLRQPGALRLPHRPDIVRADFTGHGHGTASCTAADFEDHSLYHWNTGRTSRVEGRLTINLKPTGQSVLVRVGEVTSGLFHGATVTQTRCCPP